MTNHDTADSPRGVVIQAAGTDPAIVARAAQHAVNLVRDVGDVPVDVVIQGAAVTGLLVDAEGVGDTLRVLSAHPTIRLLACQNAMRANHVTPAQLAAGVASVPAGIGHIARRQWQGWAYAASH